MAHVFISYNISNQPYARKLADKLLSLGFDVWIDDRIDYGEDWWSVIVRAIRACGAFVVIMTPESDQSRWVQREVTIADELRKPIFPLLLNGNLKNSENWMIFVRTQYVDVSSGNLPEVDFYRRLAKATRPKPQRGQEVTTTPEGEITRRPAPPEVPGASLTGALSDARPATQSRRTTRTNSLLDVSSILPEPFEWCRIPEGEVILEDASIDGGSHGGMYKVDRFFIAKYPVTVAQFQAFVDAPDGWDDTKWWDFSPDAAFWRKAHRRPAPLEHDDPTVPRTFVPWYDALAFCNWLTSRVSANLGDSHIKIKITLPTEQQWQRAARGDNNAWEYPWGPEFDKDLCNTPHSRNRQPTPVNKYPRGASPYGVFDMSGNVWEWCLTEWITDSTDLTGERKRVVRGGSWDDMPHFARVVNRNWFQQDESTSGTGFRIVLTAG